METFRKNRRKEQTTPARSDFFHFLWRVFLPGRHGGPRSPAGSARAGAGRGGAREHRPRSRPRSPCRRLISLLVFGLQAGF